MTGMFGTYNRGTPCVKCGGTAFYVTSGNCVACQKRKNAEKKKRQAAAGDKPGRKKRKATEAASNQSTVASFLARKW